VGEGGLMMGTYTNGQTVALAQVSVAQFPADNLLKRLDGGLFSQTLESGQPIIGAGTSIVGASTEASNVDIADEFSKMIVTQQAYSANTRVVTTAQTMLQDVINIVR
jgi:flagellar hook protein FlgE